jgi:hypothetical protein
VLFFFCFNFFFYEIRMKEIVQRDGHTFFSTCMHLFLHIIKSALSPLGQNTLRAGDAMLVPSFLYFKTKGGDGGGGKGTEGVLREMREW